MRRGPDTSTRLALLTVIATLVGCGAAPPPAPRREHLVVSVLGTNDLHGHVEALPAFSGYVANLRAARAEDGGAVVLLDGGDMFQGTLESNLAEGEPIVLAYAALGYDAVTIGNHEFDYGPVGERATPREPGDDPLGALRARIEQAPYAFLSANLLARADGARAQIGTDAREVLPTIVLERGGARIGVIGVTTEQTLTTTIAANVSTLAVRPLRETLAEHAAALRSAGADVVIVAAHAGGRCEELEAPEDLSSCDPTQEIMGVAEALAPGAVDVIVAGHTHAGMAHVVHGIAIIESFSYGRAFGRVDLVLDGATHRVLERRVMPPTPICRDDECASVTYEGRPLAIDPQVASITERAIGRAAELRSRPIGVTLATEIPRAGSEESPLGNLFTDLMRASRPNADVALYNGGGLRADLPAGPLTYGAFYEALPFDNRFALVRMSAGDLARMLVANATRDTSFLSVSGVRATLRCEAGALRAALVREDGRALADADPIVVVVSDFLATGGDGVLEEVRSREGALTIEDDPPIREAMLGVLSARGGTLEASTLFDPERRRVSLPSERPVRCP